jgi:hypothetical protein
MMRNSWLISSAISAAHSGAVRGSSPAVVNCQTSLTGPSPNALGRFWRGRHFVPFRITGFKPIERTPAFQEMTLDDARWMARLIAQRSETQLVEALIVAGFDSAHVRLYMEKLVSRRDQMLRDLGLADAIPPLRPDGVDRHFTYVPALDGKMRCTRRDGQETLARTSDAVVAQGRVMRITVPAPAPPLQAPWLDAP